MFLELIRAFLFIFIAEMGDKTQILAMAFATKYPLKKVILGIFIGSFLNHALAVLLGANLSTIIPLNTLSIIAGFSFIVFALWSLKLDDEETEVKPQKYGPTLTVAIAFFIGELGDKTQLTAIALSTDANYPLFILMGTVTGMVVTGLLGIFVGVKLGNKIDEFYIKIGASIVFFVFGILKLLSSLPSIYLNPVSIIVFLVVVLGLAYFIVKPVLALRRLGTKTPYQQTAQRLQDYYKNINMQIEEICLGLEHCGSCSGGNCLIGATKLIIAQAKAGKPIHNKEFQDMYLDKDFDLVRVQIALQLTLEELNHHWDDKGYDGVHQIRQNMEQILYGKPINQQDTFALYLQQIQEVDPQLYHKIKGE